MDSEQSTNVDKNPGKCKFQSTIDWFIVTGFHASRSYLAESTNKLCWGHQDSGRYNHLLLHFKKKYLILKSMNCSILNALSVFEGSMQLQMILQLSLIRTHLWTLPWHFCPMCSTTGWCLQLDRLNIFQIHFKPNLAAPYWREFPLSGAGSVIKKSCYGSQVMKRPPWGILCFSVIRTGNHWFLGVISKHYPAWPRS